MKRICALTMARNDAFFLKKWISYYSQQLGEENLYVFLDGEDQQIPPNVGKSNITKVPKIGGQVVKAEKARLQFLSDRATELLANGYDMVVGCDADEFLVVDPNVGKSLRAYLSELDFTCCKSALGIDVGQHLQKESPIDWDLPFLQQRSYAYICSRYTKPVVVNKPCRWGAGFHRVKGHNFSIDPNLYLFHFGSFDMKMIEDRYQDKDRMSAGWGKHIDRRAKTIYMVSNSRAKTSEKYLKWSRWLQSTFRPIYALNKPSMCWIKWIVCIPKRFSNIL